LPTSKRDDPASNGVSIQGIGRISMDGTITDFPLPEPGSAPFDIVTGPDGNLRFTDNARNEIDRISPDGIVARCPIPTANNMPERIAVGADGQLWFTERSGNKIGRMAP
jgi:virginiamycin B lyase